LLLAEETILDIYNGKDSISWLGTYLFEKGKLKDYYTNGHGKSETDDWDPEKEVLYNF
jgi:hypothetical protein